MTSQQIWKLAEFIYTWERSKDTSPIITGKPLHWNKLSKPSKEIYFDSALLITLRKVPQGVFSSPDLKMFNAIADFFLR